MKGKKIKVQVTILSRIHVHALAVQYKVQFKIKANKHFKLKSEIYLFSNHDIINYGNGNGNVVKQKVFFTITAEIHARSLANFYCQYADRDMNLKFIRRVSEREREIRQFVIVKNKLMSVFLCVCPVIEQDRHIKTDVNVTFLCVCPVIDHEFRHNIVKVVVNAEWIRRLL